ncbi:2-keto-4-pentenoate hydratase [Candidatus Poriferisodalis sp.]|uniref:2-keto-4-pentenoate hydratase n=1 Tax=Candidatus Poriferisodalis sp. TaxID=3101277 RepID=UPI003B01B41D
MTPPQQLNPGQLAAADALTAYFADGGEAPVEAFADLSFEDGLAIQCEMQRRAVASGAVHAGWKVGLTSDRARTTVGIDDRPFGHVNRVLASPAVLPSAEIRKVSIEPEMCFVIGERIAGDDVDPASVPGRIAQVCAGYEVNEARVAVGGNLAMLVADNLTNWAIVRGSGVDAPPAEELDRCVVTVACDGTEQFSCTAADEVDNPYLSIARLAATLHRHGLALEPGQSVITGAYARFRAEAGQRWVTSYSGIGDVEATIS